MSDEPDELKGTCPMLTMAEAAQLLHCDQSYVAKLLDCHKLPGAILTKFGQRKVPQSSVMNWLNQSRMPVDSRKLPYPLSLLELVADMRPEAAAEVLASYDRTLIREREELKKIPDGSRMPIFTDEQMEAMADEWKAYEDKAEGQISQQENGIGAQTINRRFRRYIILPKRADAGQKKDRWCAL